MLNKIIKCVIYGITFLLPLFFLPFSLEALEFNKFYLLFLLTSAGVLCWLGRMIFQDKKISFKFSLLDPFVLAFLAATLATSFFSMDKVSSFLGPYGRFWPSAVGILCLSLFYFLVVNNTELHKKEGRATLNGVLKCFLGASFIAVVLAYLSVLNVLPKLASRFSGVFPSVMTLRTFNLVGGSLEALSVFLVCCSVLLITFIALKDKKGLLEAGGKGKQNVWEWALYSLLFLDLGLLILINFRAAWIVLIVSLLVFLTFAFWKRVFRQNVNRLSLSIFFVLVALCFLLFNPLKQILPSDWAVNNLPNEMLLNQRASWKLAWEGLKENPVAGSGTGTFFAVFSKHKPSGFMQSDFWQLRFDRAGGHLAEFAATGGLINILSYLALIGMFGFVSYLFVSNVKTQEKEERKIIVLPFLITFVALIVAQFFYYQNTTLAFFFFLVLALGTISWSNRKEKVFNFTDFPEVGLVISILFWLLLTAVVFLFFSFGKYYMADVFYKDYLTEPGANLAKLEKAIKLNPGQSIYHLALSREYLNRLQEESRKESPDAQALTNLMVLSVKEAKAAITASPNKITSYEMAGVVYEALQGVAKDARDWAIKSFEDGLGLEPQHPILLTELGKLYLANENKERAKEYFEKAVSVRPAFVEAHLALAFMESEEGNSDAVKERLENLVKQAPFSVDARFELGRNYFNNQGYEKAREQFEAAVVLFPNHSNSLYSLGLTYEKLNRAEDAISALEKVLELNPGNKDIEEKIEKIKAGDLDAAGTKNYSQEELEAGSENEKE